ncbi:metal ABC transporter permease [bacterium]|nr:metal ABC transporter permease [bacterium]
MNSPLHYVFFQNALIAGLLTSLLAGLFSYFIVVRKMSFFTLGISHSAFGGISLGLLLGFQPFWAGVIFAVLMAILLSYLDRSGIDPDTAVGVLFPFAMAIGIIAISLNDKSTINVFSFLFGDILSITGADITIYLPLFIVNMIFFFLFFNLLIYSAFDRTDMMLRGVKVKLLELTFNIFLAITVMLSLKLLGIILVSALFVIPGAAAVALGRNYKSQIILSVVFSLIAIISGLFISFYLSVPTGPLIIIALVFIFVMSLIFGGNRLKSF